VLVSILTFGLSFAGGHSYQADSGGTGVVTDNAAAPVVGGSDDASCPVGLALIVLGMSGLLGTVESLAIIAAGVVLLSPCLQ
jgi:hypothetical protein